MVFPFHLWDDPAKGNNSIQFLQIVDCLPYTMYFILLFIKYKDHVHVYIK